MSRLRFRQGNTKWMGALQKLYAGPRAVAQDQQSAGVAMTSANGGRGVMKRICYWLHLRQANHNRKLRGDRDAAFQAGKRAYWRGEPAQSGANINRYDPLWMQDMARDLNAEAFGWVHAWARSTP